MGPGQDAAGPSSHSRHFYLIRSISVIGGLGVSLAYALRTDAVDGYLIAILVVGLLYPHLAYLLTTRLQLGKRAAHATLMVDAFVSGSATYLVGFLPLPSVALALVALVYPVALNGLGMIGWTSASFGIAIAIPWWLRGPHIATGVFPAINAASVVFLFGFYLLFAHAVYLRTNALQASRAKLREQGEAIEREKKRSDALLLSILPRRAAHDYHTGGASAVRACHVPDAALLLISVPDLTARTGDDPAQLLALTAEVCRAADAIVTRHGLEGLRSTGHQVLAIGGLDGVDAATAATRALRAAREIALHLHELADAEAAHGRPPLLCSVVVHVGPVTAGVIETTKVGYEVLGPTVLQLHELARTLPAGQFVLTAAAAGAAGLAVPAGAAPVALLPLDVRIATA